MQSTPRAAPSRSMPIDTLRGVAVFLMVAGHVIGSTAERGMRVSDDSIWRLSYLLLEDVRMPLFTVLSGAVYAYRPVIAGRLGDMVRGKARRLLIPMVTVGTAFFVLQSVVPGTNSKPDPSEYWRLFLFGYEYLWFVQAIFLVFVVVGALDRFGWLNTAPRWGTVLALSTVLSLAVDAANGAGFFSSAGATYLLPFFLIGYGATRYASHLQSRGVMLAVVAALAITTVVKVSSISDGGHAHPALSLALGMSAVTILMLVRRHLAWAPLAWIGRFSFGVYLLHVFGAAAARIALGRVGVENDLLMFVGCLVAGIAAPIAFELVFGRYALISWGVLGQRPRRREAQVEQTASSHV